jgi:hypothetical protein
MSIGRTMIVWVLGFLPLWQDFAVASNLAMANTVRCFRKCRKHPNLRCYHSLPVGSGPETSAEIGLDLAEDSGNLSSMGFEKSQDRGAQHGLARQLPPTHRPL